MNPPTDDIPLSCAPTEDVPISRAPASATDTMQTTGGKEWKMGNVVVGMHVDATTFMRAILINENINTEQFANLETKTIRQLGCGQTGEDGNDVSGFVAVSDVGAAILFTDTGTARKWANNINQVNIEMAPSLTYITSTHVKVTLLKVEL